MLNFVLISVLCIGVLLVIVFLHYELMRGMWGHLSGVRNRPRRRAGMAIVGLFLCHIAGIWLYAAVYYFLATRTSMGGLHQVVPVPHVPDAFLNALYFSAATYSSLGLGDIVPTGYLRLVAGSEALVGLCMIGWSASFTYLAMVKFWELPHGRAKDS